MTQILEDVRDVRTDTLERVREDHGRRRCSAPQQVAESVRPIVETMLRKRITELVRARKWILSTELKGELVRAAREIVECLRAAVACSIVVSADQSIKAEFQKTAWEALLEVLPEYDEPAVCVAAFPAESADSRLIVALAAEIARYAGSLVERGLLGFIVYRAGGKGAYSYLLRRTTVLTDEMHIVEEERQTGYDPRAPYGQRITYTSIVDHQGVVRHVTEEHVHHLRDWRDACLSSTYLVRMAPWARRVRDVIPPWIARHVQMVTGTIVEEEVHELDPVTNTWSLPRVAHVWKGSPAFRFGDLVLTGWSSSDLGADALADKQWITPLLIIGGIAAAVGACFIPGVGPAIARGATFLLGLKRFV